MFKSRLNVKWALVVLTALMLFQGYLFYQFVQDFAKTRFWLSHTYEVINELKTLSSEVKQNKLEKIAYQITGNSNFLKKNNLIIARMEKIKQLVDDNPLQKDHITFLESVIIKQLDSLTTVVKNFDNLSSDQVTRTMFNSSMLALDEEGNKIITNMIGEEERLLTIRLHDNQVVKERFYRFNLVAGGVTFIVLIALVLFLMQNLAAQKKLAIQRMAADIKFKKLFELSSDPHLFYDDTGIIDCNEAVLKMLRCYQKSQLIGIHPAEFSSKVQSDGKTAEAKKIEIENAAREHGYHNFEWILRRFDGVEIPIEVSITPIMFNEKETFLVVWHDVSEQRKYQNMLEQLHKINSNRSISLDSRVNQILKLGCQYFHLPNGVLGKVKQDNYEVLYSHTADHGILPGTNIPLSINTIQLFNIRFLLALDDVGSKEIYLQQSQIKSYIGCPVYVHGLPYANLGFYKSKPRLEGFTETEKTFVHLISEWISKEIETEVTLKELEQSKERLERAIKSANDGLWEWNCVTNKVYVNPRYKEILGYQIDELDDNLETFTNLIHPDDSATVWNAITATFEKDVHFNVEFRFRKKDGTYVWVNSRGDVYRDQSGKPILMTGFITDIQKFKEDSTKQTLTG